MFFYFGPTPDSWAIGNDVFSYAQNLPPSIQQVWDTLGSIYHDPSCAGTLVSWMSTSPDGAYAVMTKGGELLSNRQDILAATNTLTSVDHIAFSPEGGWIICFADGTVQLSKRGFSRAFYALIRPYLDVRSTARQHSRIRDVFFGANGAVAVQTDTELLCQGLPPGLQHSLQAFVDGEMRSRGFVLGRNTVFCPSESEYYFLDAHSQRELPRCIHQLPQEVPLAFISSIISGQTPAIDLIPKNNDQRIRAHSHSPPTPHTSSFPSPSSNIPASARARYESQFAHESQGRPYLTGIEAAMVLQGSGLPRSDLSRIWEQTDKDQNGKFDKEEFVQAMWLIDLQMGRAERAQPLPSQLSTQGYWSQNQAAAAAAAAAAVLLPPPAYTSQPSSHPPLYQPTPPSQNVPYQQPPPQPIPQPMSQPVTANGMQVFEATTAVVCIDCEIGLVPGDIIGHCRTCKDLYCQPCRLRAHHRCLHNLEQATLKLGPSVPSRGSTSCDECLRSIKKEQLLWFCEKCWHKKLCEKCWRKKKRHCKHAAQGMVQMMLVKKKSDDEVGEILDVVGEVVGALAGV